MTVPNKANIARLYRVMVELLHAPKTIEVMRKMPAYVKYGEVFDFNDRSFGNTVMPDGNIFKDVERVKTTQAVTSALKRDYTTALEKWLDDEIKRESSETEECEETSDSPKEKKSVKTKEDESESFDLVAEVKDLLKGGKLKKAKKLLSKNEDHADIKKATKKYEKAAS